MTPKFNRKQKKILNKLGEKILKIRIEKGLTQEDVVHKINMERTYLGGIESGKRNPSTLVLTRIAYALNVDPSELLRGNKFSD